MDILALYDCVVEYRNCEDDGIGINLDVQACQATEGNCCPSPSQLTQKRISAGLLTGICWHSCSWIKCACICNFGWERQTQRNWLLLSGCQNKRQYEFIKLQNKFIALCAANKPMLSAPEIKILVQWLWHSGDLPAPQTRQTLLTCLGETSQQGDQQAPQEIKTVAASPPYFPLVCGCCLWRWHTRRELKF